MFTSLRVDVFIYHAICLMDHQIVDLRHTLTCLCDTSHWEVATKTATILSISRNKRQFEADSIGKDVLLSYDHFSSTAVSNP